ncbi:UDP-N-acetylmuramate dehydrogenase [Rickettsia endosymbiont of Polydrusus tereticollis]|uniref:UDP-N-acetylmuramate dehydrogenase n=1 Tax=Rickettsia endosymbiont of Polydrusus tereticollis TaxID=3066251 RepID=UPI00313335F7
MKLPKIRGEYRRDYNLKHLTWFKVGGNAEIFFKPADTDDLVSFLQQNNQELPVTILGAGSNIIIRDGGIEGCVIKLGQNFTNIELTKDNRLAVGSGCLNYNLAKFCQANSISGFEFLVGIPGTIGGGVAMNAGSYNSEFKDIIVEIETVDFSGKTLIFSNEGVGFKYRSNNLPSNLIITKAIFKTKAGSEEDITQRMNEINDARSQTQPIKERTGGSTFANPTGKQINNVIPGSSPGMTTQHFMKAWQLIDKAGLRGYRIGDASISELHCNFMINHGNATAKELEDLGNFVQQKVFEDSGVKLEWEIKRIGRYS